MTSRTILSRPRTRIYDANYNIGENYYRPAIDRLDRKYYGRPLTPPRNPSLPRDLLERHERAFAGEDLATSRRRAEKHITEGHLFDSRGGRIAQRAADFFENDIDQENASSLRRIRANKRVTVVDDMDLENTVNNINSRRLVDRSEKLLNSVGLDERSRRGVDEDVTFKKRSLKVSYQNEGGDLTKWSPVKREVEVESAASLRAKQSRDRLVDLEDEMAQIAEKQAAREQRTARLKALLAESAEETEAAQSAIQAVSFKSRRERQTIEE